jgi:O-antigen ligase
MNPGRLAVRSPPDFLPRASDLGSVEGMFAFFLLSGRYKTFPELRGFPMDFTALFFILTVLTLAVAVVYRRIRFIRLDQPSIMVFLFTEFAAVSLFWSSLDYLNVDKVVRFALLTSSSFFLARLVNEDPVRRARLVRIATWIGVAILLYYSYYRWVRGVDMQSTNDTTGASLPANMPTYLEYNELASTLFIVSLALGTFGSWGQAAFGIGAAFASMFWLLTIGGRGPLVTSILAIPLLVVGSLLRNRGSLKYALRGTSFFVALAVIGAAAYFMASPNSSDKEQFRTLDRFQSQLSNEDTHSLDERADGRERAFELWLIKPVVGWGFGEYRVVDSYLQYPHNLPLEVLMETGIIGAILLLPVLAFAARASMQILRSVATGWVEVAVALIFLTDLAQYLTVQGYLADDRIFFAQIGAAVGTAASIRRAGQVHRTIGFRQRWPGNGTRDKCDGRDVSARGTS